MDFASLPPELMKLLSQRPAAIPQVPGVMPANGAPVMPVAPVQPAAEADPEDAMRGSLSAPPQAKPTPPPTDDPGISSRATGTTPEIPKPPDMSSSPVMDALKNYQDTESKIGALKQPNPQDYRPKWWERAIGIGLGATQLRNPENAGNVASQFTNRRYNAAEGQYESQMSPLQRQLEAERGAIPIAEAAARIPQQDYENKEKQFEDQEKQFEAGNEVGDKVFQETGPDGKVKYYQTTKTGEKREVPTPKSVIDDQRKRDEDANSPAPGARPEPDPANKGQFRIKTKAGGYVAWAPKSIDEGALYGYPGAKGLYDEAHRDRAADAANQGGWTPAESREISSRTRPFQTRINALERTRTLLVGSTDKEDQAQLSAIDADIQKQHEQIDSVESDVLSRRKGGAPAGSPQKPFQVPAGAPSAKGVADGRPLKMNGQVIAVAKGGEWVAPNSGGK